MLTKTSYCIFFFFNDTATTEIYTLSLHDALPISKAEEEIARIVGYAMTRGGASAFLETLTDTVGGRITRSEEHTSELQSQSNLVCRLLLEKKKYTPHTIQ